MQIKNLILVYIIIILINSSVLSINVASESLNPPNWDKNWSFRQELSIPISTENPFAIYQPIDIQIEFKNHCWALNEKEHSIRVLCWKDSKWYELESQIYDLAHIDSKYIKSCGLIFLIPNIADGNEKYFVYYDRNEKNGPNYIDHVNIKDKYYYFEPISGVSAEGDYYEITEDGFVIYGIGQKGKAINRWLSQAVVKQKPGSKEFSLLTSDNLASFCFSYHEGVEEEDEISSDQSLISKEIIADGNLMIEFKITSESYDENIRTTNIYKYYYCPTDTKRINVHVKHQVLKDVEVKGIINVDGRYGAIISYKSTSEKIKKMRFGEILPFLHVYDENNKIREYQMILDPEDKNREWVVPYTDDCDIGKNSWLSYDEGDTGKAHGIIFSSNKNIVKSGTNERDGIQVKVAEKEYLKVIGSEIDYAAINWGRNSYENGGFHDIDIPGDLLIEYDAEFYTTEKGGYNDVIKEAEYYQTLIKYRHKNFESSTGEDEEIYTLTVVPRLTARFFSHPLIVNITGFNATSVFAELYKDGKLISKSNANKPLLGPPNIKFPKLALGNYSIKIFRRIGDNKSFIGFETVNLESDTEIDVYCTWPVKIKFQTFDQYVTHIENISLFIYKNESLIEHNITGVEKEIVFIVPFMLKESYTAKAFFKGFKIYDSKIPIFERDIDIKLDLYNLKTSIEDKLGFSPGVDVRPYITSPDMYTEEQIYPKNIGSGKYLFEKIPSAKYILHISYGSFLDEVKIDITEEDEIINAKFNANYDLSINLLDSLGSEISDKDKKIDIYRGEKIVFESIPEKDIISLPPATYTAYVYSKDDLVAVKNIFLTNDKNVKIVTKIESIIPILFTILSLIFIAEISVIFFIKKLSLNSFLKLLAMSLILISLVQPWWFLNATTSVYPAEKNSEMFIISGNVIEKYNYDRSVYYDIATIPEVFTDFLAILLFIVISGFILLGLSFLPNIIYKRRFYKILIFCSVLFLLIVTVAYYIGLSKITELSLGSLQGSGVLEVVLPSRQTVNMHASWGLGLGFYLCILSAVIALLAGVSDYIRRKINTKSSTAKSTS